MNTDWHDLIQRYIAGLTTDEESALLQDSLKRDDAVARLYLRYMNLDVALEAHAGSQAAVTEMLVSPHRSEAKRWTGWLQWRPLAAAAALLILAAAGVWLMFGSSRETVRSFATLMATTNARWSDPNVELALSSGERVTSALRLESGLAEFQMLDGATVVLDGPANVRFTDRKTVFVDEGRVFCKCPTPESRITVVTPQTRVVDLGTEFSVDARTDDSTRVAVLSGKVQVMSLNAGVLTAGEVIEVKRDQVVRLKPLTPEEIAALMPEVVSAQTADDAIGGNLLIDPGFEKPLPSPVWRGTDDCLERTASLGRSGHAVRIHAKGNNYPLVKQRVETGDISGKIVQASVWAMSPSGDPFSQQQSAVLKLAFLNAEGREFACSARHFLQSGEPANVYVQAHLAAKAPQGTRSVEVQLILAAASLKTGSVCFDDVSLLIAADAAK